MAGGFGYERGEQYRVSMACGERVILPAVRGCDPDTLVIADGFSCREQIEQATGRQAVHLAQVLAQDMTTARRPKSAAAVYTAMGLGAALGIRKLLGGSHG